MSSISAKAGAIVDLATLLLRWPASLGQKAMAASTSVTVANDQTAVPTTRSDEEVLSFFDAFGTSVAISAKATPGYLTSVYVTNKNAALRYLQVHDKASAPVSTNVPVMSLPIPAGSATVPGVLQLTAAFFGPGGRSLPTGVAIGISTAEATYTAATAADHDISGSYS